jgi:hypothetical protein
MVVAEPEKPEADLLEVLGGRAPAKKQVEDIAVHRAPSQDGETREKRMD